MSANNFSEDIREELLFLADQSRQNILASTTKYQQDDAQLDVLIEDWTVKFLPRKYHKSQTNWFVKRGISWHIAAAARCMALDKDLEVITFNYVFFKTM